MVRIQRGQKKEKKKQRNQRLKKFNEKTVRLQRESGTKKLGKKGESAPQTAIL